AGRRGPRGCDGLAARRAVACPGRGAPGRLQVRPGTLLRKSRLLSRACVRGWCESDAELRMSAYLLIETRSRWESGEVEGFLGLAKDLASAGERVDLLLIQNGVLISRDLEAVADLMRTSSATIWADDVSLALRGIAADQ